ncbi:uracil-DNA glycosylase [Archaeoglobales archaeon]|nr:MAG: uracil-DNA glycosylase [Archaeoglobales archaeon]
MDSLATIEEEIKKCKKCDLWSTKRNYVPGDGSENADVVFIGEAPGREEDLQGKPFVGNAGKLLTEMIEKIGLTRKDVFIGNVLKCRPPNNRDPTPEEIEACSPYLIRQLEVIKPKVIVCLGRFSASFIFELFGLEFTNISRVRRKVFNVERWGKNVSIIALYHPAAILYRPQLREEYEKEFGVIKDLIGANKKEKKKIKNSTLLDYFD